MKLNSKLMTLALALLFSASAFASDSHKASLQTFDVVQVSGKQLPAGEYQLKWEGSGPDVQLSILKNNKVVATTPAKVVELEQKTGTDAALVSKTADGTRQLTGVRFGGKKYALAIGEGTAQAEMKASDGSK
jgi:hypothetical protein